MKPNAVPFLFLPGFALTGWVSGEWEGLTWALALWTAVVMTGTVVHALHYLSGKHGTAALHGSQSHASAPARTEG